MAMDDEENRPPAAPSPYMPPYVPVSGFSAQYRDMLTSSSSKFYSMWGSHSTDAFLLTHPGDGVCWQWEVYPTVGRDPRVWMASIAEEDGEDSSCDAVNWFDGPSAGPHDGLDPNVGSSTNRTTATLFANSGTAPALLGLDVDIWRFCSHAIGKAWADLSLLHTEGELVRRCVQAKKHILVPTSWRLGWSMCHTFKWLMCAVKGQLPGQRGNEIHFATAPYTLTFAVWDDPGRLGGYWPTPHDQHFAASDVFYAQVAILNLVCENRAYLFQLDGGEAFQCRLDYERLEDLRVALLGGREVAVPWWGGEAVPGDVVPGE